MDDPAWVHESVHLSFPDPRWPALAAELGDQVRAALAPWLDDDVHHVGSTSVPGLEAKPILDLCAGIRSLDAPVRSVLEGLGWCHVPPEIDGNPWRRFYVLPRGGRRYAHLHLVVPSSVQWPVFFAFPARLRADAKVRDAYAALKRGLAARHHEDREAYTRAKADFILAVLREAQV